MLSIVVISVALAATGLWLGIRSSAATSGDPGGRIMRALQPLVRVFPGFGKHIAWSTLPVGAKYAALLEPGWDSCDGAAGTFGWDPVVIQVGFQWSKSPARLIKAVNARLSVLGFHEETAQPSWVIEADFGGQSWIRFDPKLHSPVVVSLSEPISGGQYQSQWQAGIEAKPDGSLSRVANRVRSSRDCGNPVAAFASCRTAVSLATGEHDKSRMSDGEGDACGAGCSGWSAGNSEDFADACRQRLVCPRGATIGRLFDKALVVGVIAAGEAGCWTRTRQCKHFHVGPQCEPLHADLSGRRLYEQMRVWGRLEGRGHDVTGARGLVGAGKRP